MVVLVIGILGTIVISRLIGASRKSKEANLRANLQRIRVAVEYFETHTGAYPPRLSDVMAPSGAAISGDNDGRDHSVEREEYKGPYIVTQDGNLPADPFTGAADWDYNDTTGDVHSHCTLNALDSTPYSTW